MTDLANEVGMTFWPGTKTPISRGNAFDHAFKGQSVMLDHAAKQAVGIQAAQKRLSAQERAKKTVALPSYRLPGSSVTLSKRTRRELGLAPRGKKAKT